MVSKDLIANKYLKGDTSISKIYISELLTACTSNLCFLKCMLRFEPKLRRLSTEYFIATAALVAGGIGNAYRYSKSENMKGESYVFNYLCSLMWVRIIQNHSLSYSFHIHSIIRFQELLIYSILKLFQECII